MFIYMYINLHPIHHTHLYILYVFITLSLFPAEYLIRTVFIAVLSQLVVKASDRTHCGEFVCRDFLLALSDGVEQQVLQTGQDAGFPSPAGQTNTDTGQASEAL